MIWTDPPTKKRTWSERYGLISLLIVREISYYLVTQHTCLLISFIIVDWPKSTEAFVKLIFFKYPLAEWFLFAT